MPKKTTRIKDEVLKSLIFYRAKGHNTKETADKIGITRSTLQLYNTELRKISDTDFKKIFLSLFTGKKGSRVKVINFEKD